MQTPVIVSIISAVVALLSAGITIFGQSRSIRLTAELARLKAKEDRRAETETRVSKYREPLAQAAYDLQSRLFNILEKNLLGAYLDSGNKRERSYVINNTVFLIGQYFAWTEIIRREIQFIDVGEDEQNRQLAELRDQIYSIWGTDKDGFGKPLRVWAGEQRAIGEQLIHEGPRGPECIGYAKFLECLESEAGPLIKALQADMAALNANLPDARKRLVTLQNALINLLAFLDPNQIRFPATNRTKVKK